METGKKTHETGRTRSVSKHKADLSAALVELLKVKTLITLTVTVACVWGFLTDKVSAEVFMSIVTMVLANYFRKGKDE